ncbi:hypothetical protein CRG98_027708 [Punica granatum]|uniref:Uncharacterized protein n=1 Tax=Punica granatum TaxID=22663 RepID=A0A2I0J6K1_PUNGR|nr:hypothetical protein CRG98_027708 [Punica granatum]
MEKILEWLPLARCSKVLERWHKLLLLLHHPQVTAVRGWWPVVSMAASYSNVPHMHGIVASCLCHFAYDSGIRRRELKKIFNQYKESVTKACDPLLLFTAFFLSEKSVAPALRRKSLSVSKGVSPFERPTFGWSGAWSAYIPFVALNWIILSYPSIRVIPEGSRLSLSSIFWVIVLLWVRDGFPDSGRWVRELSSGVDGIGEDGWSRANCGGKRSIWASNRNQGSYKFKALEPPTYSVPDRGQESRSRSRKSSSAHILKTPRATDRLKRRGEEGSFQQREEMRERLPTRREKLMSILLRIAIELAHT